jgi:hypothetical protein
MTMSNGSKTSVNGSASVSEVFEKIGDRELAAIHALERSQDGLDEVGLASEARLGVSAASRAAGELADLGLVEVSEQNGRRWFRLVRKALRQQVEDAPEALFSS